MAASISGLRGKLERRLAERREEGEAGFTLIELLVVLLIIGILLAIAIPTYLTVVKSANNTAATSNLQTADTAADMYYTENNASYAYLDDASLATVSSLTQQGSGLVYESAGPTGTAVSRTPTEISILVANGGQSVVMASQAAGDRCDVVVDNKVAASPGTGIPASATGIGTWYGSYSASPGSCSVAGDTAVPTTGALAFSDTGFSA